MLQPRHIANMGLAAYKPPLATVFGYDPTQRVAYLGPMLIEEDASYETFDETTVASSSGRNRLDGSWAQLTATRHELHELGEVHARAQR